MKPDEEPIRGAPNNSTRAKMQVLLDGGELQWGSYKMKFDENGALRHTLGNEIEVLSLWEIVR
jgi:hypothetical protein